MLRIGLTKLYSPEEDLFLAETDIAKLAPKAFLDAFSLEVIYFIAEAFLAGAF